MDLLLKIYFLDVFGIFLKYDHERQGMFRNEYIFVSSKNIHLNKIGSGLLAKTYLRIIHANKFNPVGFWIVFVFNLKILMKLFSIFYQNPD